MTAPDGVQVFERYSAVILPILVVAEQVGVSLPTVPALLAVGALAADGRVNVVVGAIAAVAPSVDLVWHERGRRRGARCRGCAGSRSSPTCACAGPRIFSFRRAPARCWSRSSCPA